MNLNAGRPGSVVLTGSRNKEVFDWIDDRIPFKCVLLENHAKYDDPERILFVVFCPGDRQELESMYLETAGFLLSSAVVLTFQEDTGIGFPILLHQSDFAFKVLSRIICSGSIHAYSAVNLNCIVWERIGSLIPFFIHNMNNILARIMGNIELAEFHTGKTDKVKEKLSIALKGTEELRDFLDKLSRYSTLDDDKSDWIPGNEADVLELTRMSSGKSVEFRYEEKSGIPRKIPVRKNLMNLLSGLIAASATISVNGCGYVNMSVSPQREVLEFRVHWNSSMRSSGLCPNSMDSAADLLNRVALMASATKLSFRLETWEREGGSVSLLVPINEEDI